MLVFTVDTEATDPDLITLRNDMVLEGDKDGVSYLFDFSNPLSFAGSNPVVDEEPVNDLAEASGPGHINVHNLDVIAFTGGGLDFSALEGTNSFFRLAADSLAPLFSAQRFLVMLYVKLPTQADWNTGGTIAPFLSGSSTTGYSNGPELITIAQQSGGILTSRRQTASATATQLNLTVPAGAYGQLAQITFARTDAGTKLRLRTSSTDTSATDAVGSNNTQDFTAVQHSLGPGPSFWPAVTNRTAVANWKAYRGLFENLAVSGRDPDEVANADWQRIVEGGSFS